MYLKVLDQQRKKVFDSLNSLPFIKDFELGGGTSLALQIGHRISVDFDFMTENPIDSDLLKDIEKNLSKEIQLLENTSDELTFVFDGVKVTFLHYPFPRLFPVVHLQNINAWSPVEIALTKAYSVGRRMEFKDYLDIYFLLKEKFVTLDKILNLCEKKYGGKFNSRLFLGQLVNMEDIDEVPINFLRDSVDKENLQNFFIKEVANFNIVQ